MMGGDFSHLSSVTNRTVKNLKPAITNQRPRSASSIAWKFLPGSLFVSLLFTGKRQRKSSRGQIIRVHVSPSGMLSKVLNNYIRNLAHASVFSDTNDVHANKDITHACHVSKAIRLFLSQRVLPESKAAKAGVLPNKPAAANSATSRTGKPA